MNFRSAAVGVVRTAELSARSLADKVIQQFCDERPKRFLLAFVYGYLSDRDLLGVRTDAEKYLVLAALNLAECVAFVGSNASK